MAAKLSFKYDREGDILYINKRSPYAEQESEEFFSARSTPRSRLSSCTRASVTLYGGKVQRSKRSCSQPMATSS
jgi:hypothetical protein